MKNCQTSNNLDSRTYFDVNNAKMVVFLHNGKFVYNLRFTFLSLIISHTKQLHNVLASSKTTFLNV